LEFDMRKIRATLARLVERSACDINRQQARAEFRQAPGKNADRAPDFQRRTVTAADRRQSGLVFSPDHS
jgi:hypothetical protein